MKSKGPFNSLSPIRKIWKGPQSVHRQLLETRQLDIHPSVKLKTVRMTSNFNIDKFPRKLDIFVS